MSFYPVGLLLGWYLGFRRGMGVVGLWLGIDVGYVSMVAMLLAYTLRIDWEEQARLAVARSRGAAAAAGLEPAAKQVGGYAPLSVAGQQDVRRP